MLHIQLSKQQCELKSKYMDDMTKGDESQHNIGFKITERCASDCSLQDDDSLVLLESVSDESDFKRAGEVDPRDCVPRDTDCEGDTISVDDVFYEASFNDKVGVQTPNPAPNQTCELECSANQNCTAKQEYDILSKRKGFNQQLYNTDSGTADT